MRVRFTRQARSKFLAILDHIAEERPQASRRLQQRALDVLRRLETFPESGRKLPEFPDLPHREVLVPPYRFFYRVGQETVWIVSVWHDAQIPVSPE